MDTDDFSDMAYELIVQAASFSHTLKAELGAMSSNYNNEDDWLSGARDHCQEILADPEDYIDFWALDEYEGLTADSLKKHVQKLSQNIEAVQLTPIIDRGTEHQQW